jgi:hypothetical protein
VEADVAGDGAMPSGSGLAAQGLPAAEVLAGVAPALPLRGVPAGDGLTLLLPTPPAVAVSPAAASCPAAADTEMVVVPTASSPSACTFLA